MIEEGQRVRLPGDDRFVTVAGVVPAGDGLRLFVSADDGIRQVDLASEEVGEVVVLAEDGAAPSGEVLAGLWAQWMARSAGSENAAALGGSRLRPYAHQRQAVYGAMLPQPELRFLLADEPGTGKTIMGGLWLRESQRLGFVRRALVVCPAHLVTKWQGDFDKFLEGGLRRITAETIRQDGLSTGHDLWVVSLELAAMNPAVFEAIHPDRAGWDAVVFDEAHRLTPTATQFHRVGTMLATSTRRALLMTATPHRGSELLFRALMHLVDPEVFPPVTAVELAAGDQPGQVLRPGPVHFLRRMKEELVDYDGDTKLFKGRRASNLRVPLNIDERVFYNDALAMVEAYFPPAAVGLARMVYGKRASSALHSLAETLRRRRGAISGDPAAADTDDDDSTDPFSVDEGEEDERKLLEQASQATREERRAIDELLGRLDAALTGGDYTPSKWPKLIDECLAPNGIEPGGDTQLVVFTEYADTADWLVDRFEDAGYRTRRYSGRDPHPVRDEVRAEFEARRFQVLVSTDAGNEGIDLQTAHVLVNWDIPWSLVRLEQRMGRIHRVGQERDVELYNLVAVDTREGDAHLKLLDNLVTAANELDGKMFDSLSLIGDIALGGDGTVAGPGRRDRLEAILARAYEHDDGTNDAIQAVKAITSEQLRQIHDAQRQTEDNLRTAVDMADAVNRLHDEQLERINPHIVERFLNRLSSAGLVHVEPAAVADTGFFYLTPDRLLDRLPDGFDQAPHDTSRALVVTSGEAANDAVTAGQPSAVNAVLLGPAQAAFQSLVDAAADTLAPSLYRGGHLYDPTVVTDYDLFCFTVDVDEGTNRTATWSYLIRVDDTGARSVPWELLANLEPAETQPRGPHPANVTDAHSAARTALDADIANRREALAAWMTDARKQLLRLPTDLTNDIDDHTERVATRQRLDAAVERRLARLEAAVAADPGEITRVGWAHITAAGIPESPTEADSEQIAMEHVAQLLRGDGFKVADVHRERGLGYDLRAARGRELRCVEVKGVWKSAASDGITLTGNELARAGILGDDYWLYVIDECHDGTGTLYARYRNPAVTFADAGRDVAVIHIRGSELAAAREDQP